jgi:tRNA ligase
MVSRDGAPYRPQDVRDVAEMLRGLEANKGKGRGRDSSSYRKTTFPLPDGRSIDSWRMADWDYKKPNLPTYSRGLFVYRNRKGNPEIAVRGYDKFFNHGEVRKTEWSNVKVNTRGPYELSVKENGCIIFISGLDDGTLLVCSKHSTGPRGDVAQSHAVAGERWIDRHLRSVGKTREELAARLREMNATAVAELCDDSFEEHVLAYSPENAGLYLHGINLNLPEFVTYPGHLVDKFADEWGFKKTMYVMMDDIMEVKRFLEGVAETGSYDGRDTEGFVIRCQARDGENLPWHDWFFKYKFEEPYLMYRQWRECTKAIIAGKPPKYKKHKKITDEYLQFARRKFAQNPKLTSEYQHNHGIISLRDAFLKERGLKGSDIIRQELEGGELGAGPVTNNVVLVPVATIGCGKTTVALALVKLFDWGHFQNDNIQGHQRRPQRFAAEICNSLNVYPVTIADRNNHQKRERQQIIDDVRRVVPAARFVALNYQHDRADYDRIRTVTRERVLNRGDNHQTIQAGSKGQDEIIGIMEGFLHRFQPIDESGAPDDAFDLVINLDVMTSSRENLETVISKMHTEYPSLFGEMPSAQELDEAIEWALNEYRPDLKHDLSRGNKKIGKQVLRQGGKATKEEKATPVLPKPKAIEYFCIKLHTTRVQAILQAVFDDADADVSRFYKQLANSRRLQPEFHVTLIHRSLSADHPEYWSHLKDMSDLKLEKMPSAAQSGDIGIGKCRVQLERVVWDSRVMAIVVRILNDENESSGGESFRTVNAVAHITVGTASKDIKPKESNDLLQRWLEQENKDENGIRDRMVKGHVVLEGDVKAVLQKY